MGSMDEYDTRAVVNVCRIALNEDLRSRGSIFGQNLSAIHKTLSPMRTLSDMQNASSDEHDVKNDKSSPASDDAASSLNTPKEVFPLELPVPGEPVFAHPVNQLHFGSLATPRGTPQGLFPVGVI